MHTVKSVYNVTIRLTSERWEHISQNHPECAGYLFDVLGTVQKPERILDGKNGEFLAVKSVPETDKFLVVVYREVDKKDGFVITAFITRRFNWMEKRSQIWP